MDKVSGYSKEQAIEWLRNIGLATSGTKQELVSRIKKYKKYPKLLSKLTSRATCYYKFQCSLDPLTIPSINAPWKNDTSKYPKVSRGMFINYAAQKKEGSQGQQEKAFRILQSRKISTVKILESYDKKVLWPSVQTSSYPIRRQNPKKISLQLSCGSKWFMLPCIGPFAVF